jgi:hypothetical protein
MLAVKKTIRITRQDNASRTLVYRAIDKALEFEAIQSLPDLKRAGRSRKRDDSARKRDANLFKNKAK